MVSGSSPRPHLSPEEAVRIVCERFGLAARSAVQLPSDRDQNFAVALEDGRRFVLKVARAGEDPDVLELQNRMLNHLRGHGFHLPRVIPDTTDREIFEVTDARGVRFLARLLTWLAGDRLCDANPIYPALWEDLGDYLGRMDRALEDFDHPAADRAFKWEIGRAEEVVRERLDLVKDPGRRALLSDLVSRFAAGLKPLATELRTGVIHGDANDHNVLVTEIGPDGDPEERRVAGLLDFGDAARSFTVGEVAIAAAYAMMGRPDPLAVAERMLSGYHRAHPLREAEIEAFFPLVGLRLCASVAISAEQHRLEPDNAYLTVSEEPAWALLRWMAPRSDRLARARFRHVCGLDPTPNSKPLLAWLGVHGPEAAPLLGDRAAGTPTPLDLEKTPVHVLDLSVASSDFPLGPAPEDAASWTTLIFRAIEDAGARVGVGRYGEVRGLYSADFFLEGGTVPQNDSREAEDGESRKAADGEHRGASEGGYHGSADGEYRTVHLGVDLFVEAGCVVYAPFEGRVHAVAHRDRPQDFGPTLILEHEADGVPFWTLYGHLDPEVLDRLSPGETVSGGEPIALVGPFPQNGNWPPHLHFQILLDPLGLDTAFPGVAPPSLRGFWQALSPDPNCLLHIPEAPPPTEAPNEGMQPHPRPASTPHSRQAASRSTPHRRDSARPGRPSGAPLHPTEGAATAEILRRRREHLGPTLSVAYRKPLKIVRGRGQFLYDEGGQPYLDCVNNVPHVGHCHPKVVEAAQRQMALLNTNTRYLHDLLVEYADRLLSYLPESLSVVYFVCSGSEANELALRMARAHTRRQDVVVLEGGYHGNTSSLVALSPYKFDGPGGSGAPPWVHKAPMPDPYRGRFRLSIPDVAGTERAAGRRALENPDAGSEDGAMRLEHGTERPGEGEGHGEAGAGRMERRQTPEDVEYLAAGELGPRYAQEVGALLSKLAREGRRPAAFFAEPLLGCGGQIVPPEGFLREAFERARDEGVVCVADEVQVGFGRVGTHFWAFEAQGAVPDVVTLGKPMGNGHPLAAVVTTREIADSFDVGMEYFNTYGGNPVSCAVGMAVLDVLEEEGLQENARVVGEYLLDGLRHLSQAHSIIGDVRGMGLYLGVELVEDPVERLPATRRAALVKERLRDHRVLVSTDGPDDNVLKIKPPLVFRRADADRLVSTLDRVLREDGIRK